MWLALCMPSVRSGQQSTGNGTEELSTDYATVLFMLAGERHEALKAQRQQWIFTTHDWSDDKKVLKYTDGKFVVVSIPNIFPNFEGYCKFIQAYNSFNLHEADVLAAQGDYKSASLWYRLLLHFDVCNSLQQQVTQRLKLLEQIELNTKDAPAAKEEIKKMSSQIPMKSIFTDVASTPATHVTDLFQVEASKVPRVTATNSSKN
jgi:hypothetical protein